MLQPTISPYIRLLRLHQPAGIWLLLWPCLWALSMAGPTLPSLSLYLLFIIGAVVMRAAGCIINDIWDRDFDRQVARTRTRPLASGEISLNQALICLIVLLSIAFIIMLLLPVRVWYLAVASLIPVAIYPAMKRVTWWPQFFLGLAFNWGALMGWICVIGRIDVAAIALYCSGILWTLGYDTIYAHQDKQDDALIGVKSSALRLGTKSRSAIIAFYSGSIVCMVLSSWLSHQLPFFYLGPILFGLHFIWQAKTVNFDDPKSCMAVFKSNAWAGIFPILGALAKLF